MPQWLVMQFRVIISYISNYFNYLPIPNPPLEPGEPNFLNDLCNHELEAVAYTRYAEPNPADVRSVLWIKNDYVILHDDLHLPAKLPTSWHLQVV